LSAGADRSKGFGAGGALEVSDIRLVEDQLGSTLVSDVVELQTVSEEQSGDGERSGVSRGADAKANTQGCNALEPGDLRLLEDGSERRGALVSDVVEFETASKGWDGNGERVGVSMGVDKQANTQGATHSRLEICVVLSMAASAEAPLSPIKLCPILCEQGVGYGW